MGAFKISPQHLTSHVESMKVSPFTLTAEIRLRLDCTGAVCLARACGIEST